MQVIIKDEVFRGRASCASLMALFHLCELRAEGDGVEPRHHLLIEPLPQLTRNPALTAGVAVEGA